MPSKGYTGGTGARAGFTLVEMVIVTAITGVILAAVAGLFVLALNTVKSGNQAMDANELTRAAFNAIERDLNTAFTAREHGEYFQFHGRPEGMSFIGVVRDYGTEFPGTAVNLGGGRVQLGRVTYVVYQDPTLYDLHETVLITDLDTATGEMVPDVPVVVTKLLRYFEPGVQSLDEYPQAILEEFAPGNAEFPQLQNEVDLRKANLSGFGITDPGVLAEIERSTRRDQYIQMLAGTDPSIYPDAWLLLGGLDPLDYVLAENIIIDPFPLANYFRFGELNLDGTYDEPVSTWSSWDNLVDPITGNFVFEPSTSFLPRLAGIGSPLASMYPDRIGDIERRHRVPPKLPEVVFVHFPFVFDSPHFAAPNMRRELSQLIRVPTAQTRRTLAFN